MKVQNHRKWNQNHIDLTRDPLSPVREEGMELKFRPAKTQYLMTPPASTSSEEMDLDQDGPEPMEVDKPQAPSLFQFKAGEAGGAPEHHKPVAFRRRIGRLNRLWIDRRGLRTPPRDRGQNEYWDRWAYDSDSDSDEPPVYEVDPFDTRALKFRAMIPLNPYVFRRPPPHPEAGGMMQGSRALPASASQGQPMAHQAAGHPQGQQHQQPAQQPTAKAAS